MTNFYSISDNTFGSRGMPWIQSVCEGLVNHGECPSCGSPGWFPEGDQRVLPERNRARLWPDLLGCAQSYLVVSKRFVDALCGCGVRMELGGAVEILEPVENRLSLEFAPPYFWVDGERHRAARMDFEASGHVGVAFCEDCGGRHNDVIATFDRQHAAPPPPVVFDYDANSGLELFTTDLSPYAFFCTERVFRCVRENRLHNVAFIRVEDGYRGPRVKY